MLDKRGIEAMRESYHALSSAQDAGPRCQEMNRQSIDGLCDLAQIGLAVVPKPIVSAVVGKQYVFFSGNKYMYSGTWEAPWVDGVKTWPEPWTHCIEIDALPRAST